MEQVDENAPWALPWAIGGRGGIVASRESAVETTFHPWIPWNPKHLAAAA